jgi:hypothetical protein
MSKRTTTRSSTPAASGPEDLDESDDSREAFSEQVLEEVWQRLQDVHLDARRRQFLWPDKNALTFNESAQLLQQQFPSFPRELIETHMIGWIEMEYVPQGYSEEQLDEFERLIEKWVDELEDQLDNRLKKTI